MADPGGAATGAYRCSAPKVSDVPVPGCSCLVASVILVSLFFSARECTFIVARIGRVGRRRLWCWDGHPRRAGGRVGGWVPICPSCARGRDSQARWQRIRGISDSGAGLVRPDGHVAWHADTAAEKHLQALRTAIAGLLGHDAAQTPP